MTNNVELTELFFGREELMASLKKIWNEIDNSGPQFIVLNGDNGAGKTKILNELYHHMSTTTDPGGYWPDNPSQKAEKSDSEQEEGNKIPWLWFQMKFNEGTSHYAVDDVLFSSYQSSMPHIEKAIHQGSLGSLIADKTKDIVATGIETATGNLDAIPDIVGVALDGFGIVSSAAKGIGSHLKAKNAPVTEIKEERGIEVTTELIRGLTKLLDRSSPMRVVVTLDDLTYLNHSGSSNKFLTELFAKVKDKGRQWPLIVVATRNPSWQQSKDAAGKNADEILLEKCRGQFLFYEHDLNEKFKLTADNLKEVIHASELPITNYQGKAFVDRADGNPSVLHDMLMMAKNKIKNNSELPEGAFLRIMGQSPKPLEISSRRLIGLPLKEIHMLEASAFQGETFSIEMILQAFSEEVFSEEVDECDTSLDAMIAGFNALHESTLIVGKPDNNGASKFIQRSHWQAADKSRRDSDKHNKYIELFDRFIQVISDEEAAALPGDMLEKLYNISGRLKKEERSPRKLSGFPRKLSGLLIISLVQQNRFVDALPVVAHALNVYREVYVDGDIDLEANLEELIAIFKTSAAVGFDAYKPCFDIGLKNGSETRSLAQHVVEIIQKLKSKKSFEPLSGIEKIRVYTEILNFYESVGHQFEERKWSEALAKLWRDYIDRKGCNNCSLKEMSDGLRCNVQLAKKFFDFQALQKLDEGVGAAQGEFKKLDIQKEFFGIFEWVNKALPQLEVKGGEYKELAKAYEIVSAAITYRYVGEIQMLYMRYDNQTLKTLMGDRKKVTEQKGEQLYEFLHDYEGVLSGCIAWPVFCAFTFLVELSMLLQQQQKMCLMSVNLVDLTLEKISGYMRANPAIPMCELVMLIDMSNILSNWLRGKNVEGPPSGHDAHVPGLSDLKNIEVHVLVDNQKDIDKVPSELKNKITTNLSLSSEYYGNVYPHMVIKAMALVTNIEELCLKGEYDSIAAKRAMTDILEMADLSRERERGREQNVLNKISHHVQMLINVVPELDQVELEVYRDRWPYS